MSSESKRNNLYFCYTIEIYLLSNSNSGGLNLLHDPLLRIYILCWDPLAGSSFFALSQKRLRTS